MGITDPVIRV